MVSNSFRERGIEFWLQHIGTEEHGLGGSRIPGNRREVEADTAATIFYDGALGSIGSCEVGRGAVGTASRRRHGTERAWRR